MVYYYGSSKITYLHKIEREKINGILKKYLNLIVKKKLKRVMPIVDSINELEESISKLSDEELKNKTTDFKAQLKKEKH